MDLLKKFMGLDGRKDDDDDKRKKKTGLKDEFRKPIWVEEYDSDDELFDNQKILGVQIFTSPLEMQKHFEQQIQEMMKTLEEYEEGSKYFDQDLKQDFYRTEPDHDLKGEKEVKNQDTDLDGQIYPDQLQTLLQRISPDLKELLPRKQRPTSAPSTTVGGQPPRTKRTDEEKIMDWIHGVKEPSDDAVGTRSRLAKREPQRFHDGIFEGTFQGPRMFGQSIISQTIRRPDGSYETRRTVRDSEGHSQTTVTLATKDGKTSVTTYGDDGGPTAQLPVDRALLAPDDAVGSASALVAADSKYAVTKNGYILPLNLW